MECLYFLFSHADYKVHEKMRMLWEQHIAWTRSTITSIAEDLQDADLVTKRLLRNQIDMGMVFDIFHVINFSLPYSQVL